MDDVFSSSGKLGSKNVISAETMSSGTGKRTWASQSEANDRNRSSEPGEKTGCSVGAAVGAGAAVTTGAGSGSGVPAGVFTSARNGSSSAAAASGAYFFRRLRFGSKGGSYSCAVGYVSGAAGERRGFSELYSKMSSAMAAHLLRG